MKTLDISNWAGCKQLGTVGTVSTSFFDSQFWTDPTICSKIKPFACITSTSGQLLMSSFNERFCPHTCIRWFYWVKMLTYSCLTFTHFRTRKSSRFATFRNISTWLLIWILNEFYSQRFLEFSIELDSRGQRKSYKEDTSITFAKCSITVDPCQWVKVWIWK